MTPLESAIAEVWGEIEALGVGTPSAPAAGSADFYRLRALAVAHAYLNRLQTLGVEQDAAACERIYRAGALHFSKVSAATPVAQQAALLSILGGQP